MKNKYVHFFLLFFSIVLFNIKSAKAQAPVAGFTSNATFAFPKDTCGSLALTFSNASTGVFDSAIWTLDTSNVGCNGPWVTQFHSTNVGATLMNPYNAIMIKSGVYYRLCLRVSNSSTGATNTYCKCITHVYPLPNAGFVVGTPIGCGQVTTNIYPTDPGTTGPYTFSWLFGGGNVATSTSCNGVPGPSCGNSTATYNCNSNQPCYGIFCIIKDAHGCQAVASDSCAVRVYCNPNANISVGQTSSTCKTSLPVTLTASPSTSTFYTWWVPNAPGGPPANPTNGPTRSKTLTTSFPSFGCYNIKLKVYDSITPTLGCVDSTTLTNAVCLQGINTNGAHFTVSPHLVCDGAPLQVSFVDTTLPFSNCCISANFIAVPLPGSPSCADTVILGPVVSCGGQVGTQFYAIHNLCSVPVKYKIIMLDTLLNQCSGCVGVAHAKVDTVTVNPSPVASVSLKNGYASSYCAPCHSFVFQANPSVSNLPGYTYAWYNNGNCSGTVASTTQYDSVYFCGNGTISNPSENHVVCLKVCQSVANGGCCAYSNSKSDTVTLTKPYGDFTYTPTVGCQTVCAVFRSTIKTDSSYKWLVWDANGVNTYPLTGVNHGDTLAHCFQGFPDRDTCYNVMLIHKTYTLHGVSCFDTIFKKKIIRVGHKVTASATMSQTNLCLTRPNAFRPAKACLQFYPDSAMHILPSLTKPLSQCSNISCVYYFTKPGKTQVVAQANSCDSPFICFADTGKYVGHFIVTDNGCSDTLNFPNQVCINGIVASYIDSVHCANQGNYQPIVTYKPSIKYYSCNPLPANDSFRVHIWNSNNPPSNILDTTVLNPSKLPARIKYTYNSGGTYVVCMSVYDKFHLLCDTDTICRNVIVFPFTAVINLDPPFPAKSIFACRDNVNNQWRFTDTFSSPPHPPVSIWKWGDGKPEVYNSDFATHIFDSCGDFQVKLIISNFSGSCKDSSHMTVHVHDIQDINGQHNNMIDVKAPSSGCNTCLIFTNKMVPCGTALKSTTIYFGEPTNQPGSSITINGPWTSVTHCYSQTTFLHASASITDTNNCTRNITLTLPPLSGIVAKFTGLPDTVLCLGTSISLTNASSGYTQTKLWLLDAAPDTCGNASKAIGVSNTDYFNYTFSQNGYYNLNFYARNSYTDPATGAFCSSDTCVRVHIQNPIADFNVPDTFPCPGTVANISNLTTGAYDHLTVTFTLPNGSIVTYNYSKTVPPGLPSYVQIPLGYAGQYMLTWSVSSVLGCSSAKSKQFYVKGPRGNFHALSHQVCLGDSVHFTDVTNSANGVLVDWDGDGSDQIPFDSTGVYKFAHRFLSCGKKTVLAYISDGSCIYGIADTVNVDCPKAKFGRLPRTTSFCGKASIQFLDSSLSSSPAVFGTTITSYLWQLIYDSTNAVIQTSVAKNPVFNMNLPGSYSVKLSITTNWGCVDSTQQTSIINIYKYPTAQFTNLPDTVCINGCINFTNTSINPDTGQLHSRWYFDWPSNLNSINSSATNVLQCYSNFGTFNTVLVDTTMHGCIDTSAIKKVVILPAIIPNFSLSANKICGNTGTVTFTNNTIPSSGLSYCWNFGDSLQGACQSTAMSPTHTFILPNGFDTIAYVVKMLVTNSVGCRDSISKTVILYAAPHAKLHPDHTEACHPIQVGIIDSSSSLTQLKWYILDWGDNSAPIGSVAAPSGITHIYPDTGTFYIHYKITTIHDCSDSLTIKIIDHPYPVACAGPDVLVCAQQNVTLGCLTLPANGYSYSWSNLTSINNPFSFVANPVVTAVTNQSYVLTMASNIFPCPSRDTITVNVIPLVAPLTSGNAALCLGGCAVLTASGGLTYSWSDSSLQVISTDSTITVCPTQPTTYNVKVCGLCDCQTLPIGVQIFYPPVITLQHTISGNNIIAGHPITVPDVVGPGVGSVLWTPNIDINDNTLPGPTFYPKITTTYHVYVTDGHGCIDSSEVTIHVLCDASNAVYVPNAFTPESPGPSGKNDRFFVQGTPGVKEIVYMRIYDRWGGIVYSAEHLPINDHDTGWNGNTAAGKRLSSDVFMYQLQIRCAEGDVFPLTGTVTLIR